MPVDGVVLLHGLGRTSGSMGLLERRVTKAGFRALSIHYPSTRQTLPAIADMLQPQVRQFAGSLDGRVHVITHSLGGLLVRALLTKQRPDNLGRVVMLAPPNGGSEWADLLERSRLAGAILGPNSQYLVTTRSAALDQHLGSIDYEVGIIAGDRPIDRIIAPFLMRTPHDGKVSVAATKVVGMTDHLILPVAHPLMPFHPRVARQAISFLKNGTFDRI
jgi:pimeloyl-ACP methyl ester carboxylesterase